jgi:AraC family transcriptional regulator
MGTSEKAVARVIAMMRDRLEEPLTVEEMARVAMFSKFHFTRLFKRVTGVSPGRYLSALRLQRAKQLLVSTSLNVTDISVRVGYSSTGTFTATFTRRVGLSPTAYRRLGITSRGDGEPEEVLGTVLGMALAQSRVRPRDLMRGCESTAA